MTRSTATVRANLATSIGWLAFWLILLITLTVTLVCFIPAALLSWGLVLLLLLAACCIKMTDVIKYRLEYREALANASAKDEAANA